MNNIYIKDFPRGDSVEQASILALLPICTEHLNTVNNSLSIMSRILEIATEVKSDIITPLSEIESQGKFNAFLNLCFLDLIVIYKNALSAIHLWDDIHCLRQGYLLIYEAIKTYHTYSKQLKELAKKTSPVAETMFHTLANEIKEFRKSYDYDNYIMEVRNYTIGHIENNPLNFYKRISSFDEEKAFSALKDFGSVLTCMLNFSDYIFINYTKKIIANSSFQLAGLHTYSIEIGKLLEALESEKIFWEQNNSFQ